MTAPPTQIQILFPSSPAKNPELYQGALAAAREALPEFTFLEPPELYWRDASDSFGYLAGTDEHRAEEILKFLMDEKCSTVWFGRGGYGVTRLLSALDRLASQVAPPIPKRLVGYSDITALFCWCRTRIPRTELIHSPMLCAFPKQPNPSDIRRALLGDPCPIPLSSSTGANFEGTLFGGNLAVLASLCGTPWLPVPDTHQAVFLEDVGEAPYRVDRFLTQLHDSGFFRFTRKVYLGTYTEHEPAWQVLDVARRRCAELDLDVLGELYAGHSEPHYPIFLDRAYRYCRQTNALLPTARRYG